MIFINTIGEKKGWEVAGWVGDENWMISIILILVSTVLTITLIC